MPKKTVVRRTRSKRSAGIADFPFTPDVFKSISGNGNIPEYIRKYRKEAWDSFNVLSIPTTQEEAWRRTNLRTLPADKFLIPELQQPVRENLPAVPDELLKPLAGNTQGGQIIFTPGEVRILDNPGLQQQGVIFTDLSTAAEKYHEILEQVMGKIVKFDEGKFSAMVSALAQNGVLLYVPKGVHLEIPVHSILWGPGENFAFFNHIMVWLEEESSATYVHESASPTMSNTDSLHAGIVELYVGPGANLRFVELQSWGEHVWNFTHERARIESDANLDWIYGAVGSKVTKNFSDLDLNGRGASGKMSGFYFTDGNQHLDHDTQQNHFAPDTTSDLLFKGALREDSRSVWQGMIYVAPGAQKTDGYQANRNLVLDSNARADSIPGLEILADDVRCTHGATVGKIDPEQIFYLLSRGIPQEQAERLIVEGFFDPVMQRIPFKGVRSRFQNEIIGKMGN